MAITDANVEEIIVKLVAKEIPKSPDMKGKLTLPNDEIIKVFKSDDNIVGVQGLDTSFRDSYILNVKNKFMGTFWSTIENFFEHASIVRLKDSILHV